MVECPDWLSNWKRTLPDLETLSPPEEVAVSDEVLKTKMICATVINDADSIFDHLINYFSSYYKVIRIIAWMTRFDRNRLRINVISEENLSDDEVPNAELRLLRHLQLLSFNDEIVRLKEGKYLRSTSRLLSLHPFLDKDGLLPMKHPIIINYHKILDSIIFKYHLDAMHGGTTATLGKLRSKFWLLNATQVVKRIVRKCLVCHRHRPLCSNQLMANLPPPRISVTKAFLQTGVDFAGPITLKAEVGRGSKSYKAYIAVFVCLAVKAIHLEVVGSLTTESLLAAMSFCGPEGSSCTYV